MKKIALYVKHHRVRCFIFAVMLVYGVCRFVRLEINGTEFVVGPILEAAIGRYIFGGGE